VELYLQYVLMAWCSVKRKKHGDNFTFTFSRVLELIKVEVKSLCSTKHRDIKIYGRVEE